MKTRAHKGVGVQCTQNPILLTCLKAYCLSEGDHITFLCWADPLTSQGRSCWWTSLLPRTTGHDTGFYSSISWVLGTFSKQHCLLLSGCLIDLGYFIPLEKVQWGALYNPYTTHWPAISYWKVPPSLTGHEKGAQLLPLGEHQSAAAHPIAFQTAMATGCTKVRKSSHPTTTSKIAKTTLFHKFG